MYGFPDSSVLPRGVFHGAIFELKQIDGAARRRLADSDAPGLTNCNGGST